MRVIILQPYVPQAATEVCPTRRYLLTKASCSAPDGLAAISSRLSAATTSPSPPPPPPPPCLEDELMFPCQQRCHRSKNACDIACNDVGGKKKLRKKCKKLCTQSFHKCKASCIPCNADWNAPLI